MGTLRYEEITIAAGDSLSGVFDSEGKTIVRLRLPLGLEGDELAFLTSDAPLGPFNLLYDETGARVSITPIAGGDASLAAALHTFVARFWMLGAYDANAVKAQAAARTIGVIFRAI